MMKSKFEWLVQYKDGELIRQYDEDGKEHFYSDICRDNIYSFMLAKDGIVLFTLHFNNPNHRLIYRQRKFMKQFTGEHSVFHIVGYYYKDYDEIKQTLIFVDESGNIEIIDTANKDNVLYEPVELLSWEE